MTPGDYFVLLWRGRVWLVAGLLVAVAVSGGLAARPRPHESRAMIAVLVEIQAIATAVLNSRGMAARAGVVITAKTAPGGVIDVVAVGASSAQAQAGAARAVALLEPALRRLVTDIPAGTVLVEVIDPAGSGVALAIRWPLILAAALVPVGLSIGAALAWGTRTRWAPTAATARVIATERPAA